MFKRKGYSRDLEIVAVFQRCIGETLIETLTHSTVTLLLTFSKSSTDSFYLNLGTCSEYNNSINYNFSGSNSTTELEVLICSKPNVKKQFFFLC